MLGAGGKIIIGHLIPAVSGLQNGQRLHNAYLHTGAECSARGRCRRLGMGTEITAGFFTPTFSDVSDTQCKGQNEKWLIYPCRRGGPKMGNSYINPAFSGGPKHSTRGTKSKVATSPMPFWGGGGQSGQWLHNPCLLVCPRAHSWAQMGNPPPRSGEKNPMFRRNVPASRFFSKRGSRCPGSQSQGANTPSFWLFGSWSNVETQSIPQFAKKNFHLSVSIWFVVSSLSEPATGPVDMQ